MLKMNLLHSLVMNLHLRWVKWCLAILKEMFQEFWLVYSTQKIALTWLLLKPQLLMLVQAKLLLFIPLKFNLLSLVNGA